MKTFYILVLLCFISIFFVEGKPANADVSSLDPRFFNFIFDPAICINNLILAKKNVDGVAVDQFLRILQTKSNCILNNPLVFQLCFWNFFITSGSLLTDVINTSPSVRDFIRCLLAPFSPI